MCGIAGILRIWPITARLRARGTPPIQAIPESWLDVLDDSIRHRGPDGFGRFRDRSVRPDGPVIDVALVHRRLSILDHAGGHQPMLSLGKGQGAMPRQVVALGHQLGLYRRSAQDELAGREAGANAGALSPGEAGLGLGASDSNGGLQGGAAPLPAHQHHDPTQHRNDSIINDRARDRVSVVFNGCIYNHRELRRELQAAGHVFATDHSDTEVLIHAWREWGGGRGDSFYHHLDGMFAFALWDHARGELVIARDRFGEKPLYLLEASFAEDGSQLVAFASTVPGLASIARSAGVRIDRNPLVSRRESLIHWLAMGWGDPGGSVGVPGVRVCPREWWLPYGRVFTRADDDGPMPTWGPREEHAPLRTTDDVEAELHRAVESRLEADVPLGCFLSGGVDSSLIAKFASDAIKKNGGTRGLDTFTVRMPDPRLDESRFARRVAEIIGSTHHEIEAQARPADDLLALITQIGVPFGDSSLLPSAWVSRATASMARVALSGDGGDELFLGYQRQRFWAKYGQTPLNRAVLARVPLAMLCRFGLDEEKARRLKIACAKHNYRELMAIFQSPDLAELWPAATEYIDTAFGGLFGWTRPFHHIDLYDYLPGDLLTKSDSASMHSALEVRAPMLARDFVAGVQAARRAWQSPPPGKVALRAIARRYFPADIIDRPKQGFAIPIGEWFRTDFGGLRTLLLDHLHSSEPFGPPSLGLDLDMRVVRRMLDEHLGTGPSGQITRDHSQRLYMLLVFSIWAKWVGTVRAPEQR